MNKVCSIALVNTPFCIIKAERAEYFNGGDLLLMNAVSREFFLPYVNFMSEVFISEKTLRRYMENYGDLSRGRENKTTEVIRVSSPDYELMSSVFSYINTSKTNSEVFHEMIMLSCISLFSAQRGFVPFILKQMNSTAQKVKIIICTDLSRAWRIKDVCALIHISESLLKKRLKSENSSFSRIVLDMRMQKAHSLIRSGYSVFQASSLCGYSNASYFISQFKKYFGITPFKCNITALYK
ncbi:TPA: AraC family transcriptional regulator [Escherichia coli]|uniref:helix-turn-helix domain-containing protein n=1 Tax=Escherichia coli TaxID=562 RepID=UPI0039C97B01|nr:AraC family transcriptional regulator [Escherichia coli]HCS6062387.1 AraC family transcriptional regulator [Escherichia coli]